MSNTSNSSLIGKSIKLDSIKSPTGRDAIVFDQYGKTYFNNITQSTSGGRVSVANGSGVHFTNPTDGSYGKVGGGEIVFDRTITTTITVDQAMENGVAVNFPVGIDAYGGYAYGNGVLIVTGDEVPGYNYGHILKSTDMGLTWTAVFNTSDQATWVYSPAYGNGIFVASIQDGRFVYSTDMGDTWTYTPGPVGGQQSFWSGGIIYAQDKFVSTGFGGKIQTSTDGITWTLSATIAGAGNLGSPIYEEGLFVVGEYQGGGKIHYSNNATNWTTVTLSAVSGGGTFTNGTYRYITYGNSRFVSIASFTTYAAVSVDGINWTQHNIGLNLYDWTVYFDPDKEKFVALQSAANPTFYESDDGITWSAVGTQLSSNTSVRTNNTDTYFDSPPKVLNGHIITAIYDNELDDSYHYIVYPASSYEITSTANTILSPDNLNIKTVDSSNNVSILNMNSNSLKIESNNSIYYSNVDYTSIGNSTVNTQILVVPYVELKLNNNGTFFSANSTLVQFTGNNFVVGNNVSGPSGYTYLNNGMLLQWGIVSSTSAGQTPYQSFTVPFPNKCLFAQVSNGLSANPETTDGSKVKLNIVQSTNNTGIVVRTLTGSEISTFYFYAIGF